MKLKLNFNLMLWLTGLWTAFTVALAGWWLVLGLRLVQIQFGEETEELIRYKRMLTQEGFALIVLLIGGGGALFVSLWILKRQNQGLRTFFATFTHELKTPLTNLRIQTEILRDQFQNVPHKANIERLAAEGVRLELQLENSLFLAHEGEGPLFTEEVFLNELVKNVSQSWSGLAIELSQRVWVDADRRALEAIFRNIFQNAVYHGKAKIVGILGRAEHGQVVVEILDDGLGFQRADGQLEKLGKLFDRSNPKSGTGVGLWLIGHLMRRMHGESQFQVQQGRLKIILKFPGRLE